MNKRFPFYLIIISLHFLSACNLFGPGNDVKIVAKVGDQLLLQTKIDEITFDQSSVDSVGIAKAYIDNWVKEQLLLQKALFNLNESQIDFENQLEDYRNSLLIYAYENELVRQKLDTNVSESQQLLYYEKNLSNFELKKDLIKARVFKFLNSAPKQDSLIYWLNNLDELNEAKLAEYCAQFTIRCELDPSQWISIQTVKSILPNSNNFELKSLSNESLNTFQDSIETVLIDLIDLKTIGETAPLEFVRNQIIEIIRNKRRLELLSNAKEEIFEEATLKKKYEIFN